MKLKLTLSGQRLFYVLLGLTLKNISTFCPHCVFMCFVRISERTAIISIYVQHLALTDWLL